MKGNRGYGRVRRGISVLIALVMVMSLISIQAFANVPVSYYIWGTMTEGGYNATEVDPNFKLTAGQDGLFTFEGLELDTEDSFGIVSSSNGVDIDDYYPEIAGIYYGEEGEIEEEGTYNVTFDPNKQQTGWFGKCINVELVNGTQPSEPTVSYYIWGTMTEGGYNATEVDPNFKLTAGQDGLFTFEGLELDTEDSFGIVSSSNGVDIDDYYPEIAGIYYGEEGEIEEEGTYNVTFDPNKQQTGWFGKCINVESVNGTQPSEPTISYYIWGSVNNCSINESFKLTAGQDGLFTFEGLELDTDDSIGIVGSYDGEYIEEENYYPGIATEYYGDDGEIKVSGTYNVTFDPEGGHEGWFGGYFLVELVNPDTPRFARHSMILDEQIGVRFELILPEDFVAAEDATVEFEVSDGRTESVLLTEVGPDDNGDLWFVCHINALELADTITATFVWGDGEAVTDTYSAVQYFEYFEDNEETPVELSALLEALQDYGHYMYESEWQDADGNGGLRAKSKHVKIENANKNADALIEAAMVWLNGNGIDDPDFSDVGAGIADVKFSLTLNSATKINLFVRMEDSVTLTTQPNGELTIGGEVYSWIEGTEIKASALTGLYTFHIDTGEGTAEIQINPMQYLKLMLENDDVSDANRAALAAFVVYAYSALEYYNSIS